MVEDYYPQAAQRYVKGSIDPVVDQLIDLWNRSRKDDLSSEEGQFLMTTLAAYEELLDTTAQRN